jgi:hypothetical protein
MPAAVIKETVPQVATAAVMRVLNIIVVTLHPGNDLLECSL